MRLESLPPRRERGRMREADRTASLETGWYLTSVAGFRMPCLEVSVLHVGVMQVTPFPHGSAGCAVEFLGRCLCLTGRQGPSLVSVCLPVCLSLRCLARKDPVSRQPTLHRVGTFPSRARFESPPSYQGRLPIFATIASSLSYPPISLHPSPPSRPPSHRQSNQRVLPTNIKHLYL